MSNYRYHCSFHEYKNSYANLVMNLAATLIRLSITGLESSSPVPSLSPDLGPTKSEYKRHRVQERVLVSQDPSPRLVRVPATFLNISFDGDNACTEVGGGGWGWWGAH